MKEEQKIQRNWNLRNLVPAAPFTALATVHPTMFLPAARFCFLFSFWFSSYFLLVIVFIFVVFGKLHYGLDIKAP